MVIGAAVSQAHLEDDAWTACYFTESPCKADMLGFQPEQQLFETRQSGHAAFPGANAAVELHGDTHR
jgi:hypothetical protein